MNQLYQELIERIRGEALDLDRSVERAEHAWPHAQEVTAEPNFYLDR